MQETCWPSSTEAGKRGGRGSRYYWLLLVTSHYFASLLEAVAVEHSFCVIVLYPGRIPQHFTVSCLEQLLAPIMKLRVNRLLHARICEFTLPRRLLRHQFHDAESQRLLGCRVHNIDNCDVLTRLEPG